MTMAAPQQAKSGSAYVNNSDMMRKAMQNRNLSSVAHLTEALDALDPSDVVCEVGCGPGGITLDIARRYPQLIVLGMDFDEKAIEMAKSAAAALNIENVRYAIGDATFFTDLKSLPGFGALQGGCSIVYTHATLSFCPDPLQVVKEMRLAAKVGGIVSMSEGDSGLFFAYPAIPGMMKMLEAFPAFAGGKGGDPQIGRKLLSHALAAGFARDDVTAISLGATSVSKPQERQGLAMGLESMFRTADADVLQHANLEPEVLDFICQGMKEWAECEDGICSFPTLTAQCIKQG